MKRVFTLFTLALLLFSSHAFAHTRSQSFSVWTVDDNLVHMTFHVDARRITQLAPDYENEKTLTGILPNHLRDTIEVVQSKNPCALDKLTVSGEGRDTLQAVGIFVCPTPLTDNQAAAFINAFQKVSPTHVHIARLIHEEGAKEAVLGRGRTSFSLTNTKATTAISEFIGLGFSHVLSGIDHLLFLLALLFAVPHIRAAILCITGFTIGHSITLALAVLGLIDPNERLIEAIIGFTIAVAALEAATARGLSRETAFFAFAAVTLCVALMPLSPSPPVLAGLLLALFLGSMARISNADSVSTLPAMTTMFGLAHGAGFAGGLLDLDIQGSALIRSLIGFNIGVELAQLVALGGVFAVFVLMKRLQKARVFVIEHTLLACLFAAGIYWYAERIWS